MNSVPKVNETSKMNRMEYYLQNGHQNMYTFYCCTYTFLQMSNYVQNCNPKMSTPFKFLRTFVFNFHHFNWFSHDTKPIYITL